MQLTLTSVLLSLLAVLTMATAVQAPQKSVIISYPEGTPMNVMEQAKEYIKEAVRFRTATTHFYADTIIYRAEQLPTSITSLCERHTLPGIAAP